MDKENLLLDDVEYGTIKKDSRVSRNQIKTRKASYDQLASRWVVFRRTLLEKQLEKKKQEFVDTPVHLEGTGKVTKASDEKLTEKAAAIARLELKIRILSNDAVPQNYVSDRAIKLHDKMMKNVRYNTGGTYFLPKEKKDVFFANDISADTIQAMIDAQNGEEPKENLDVRKILTENQEELASEIQKVMDDAEDTITADDIESSLEEAFSNVGQEATPISAEDVEEAVNSTFVEKEEDNIQEEDIHEMVQDALDQLRVSRNNSQEVKKDRYDENGKLKSRSGYEPMSDEEIAQAREELESQEYNQEEAVNKTKPLQFDKIPFDKIVRKDPLLALVDREMPVVVPVRAAEKEEEKQKEVEENKTRMKDVKKPMERSTTVSSLEALKLRAKKLQEENKRSRMESVAAKEAQEQEALKAQQFQEKANAKKEAYEAHCRKLEEYCLSLEEDTEFNVNEKAKAEKEAESSRVFIEEMIEEMNSYDDKMNEIDEIMGEEGRVRRV